MGVNKRRHQTRQELRMNVRGMRIGRNKAGGGEGKRRKWKSQGPDQQSFLHQLISPDFVP